MDNSIRLQYLETMGVDVWVSRENVSEENSDIEEQSFYDPVVMDNEWQLLQQEVAHCNKCGLSETCKQRVFGEGSTDADWMLVGEAPDHHEEEEGKPFLGQSGFLLTEMLRAIGVDREAAYITNIVKCRPVNNKDPKVDELKSCRDYLQSQVAGVKPKIILAVGRIAAHSLLGTKQPLSELRGIVHYLDEIPVIVIYHPAYLLRSLLEKRKAWRDLQLALKIYQEEK